MKIIKKFISQKCIGYSYDFNTSFFESVVEYEDGTTGTIYATSITNPIIGFISNGPVTTERPFVPRQNKP